MTFVDNITPSGSTPGTSFTLPSAPNPPASLRLYWNGDFQTQGELGQPGVDYNLVNLSITMVNTVGASDTLRAFYRIP